MSRQATRLREPPSVAAPGGASIGSESSAPATASAAAAIVKVQPLSSARVLREPYDYALPKSLRGEVKVGSLLVVPFAKREVLGVAVALSEQSELPAGRLLEPLRVLDVDLPSDLVALARWIADEYCSTLARALRLLMPPGITRGQLAGKARRTRVVRPEHRSVGVLRGAPPRLTSAQQAALDELIAALEQAAPEPYLLQGVTGSGKTEVYLQVAAAALAQGRGAIVLVPEIALTPQIVARFTERFGETVAVLHSRLSTPERREEWRRLRSGQARVCVGPRSAVFAPIEGLGLIVLDEEHDASYKHEGDPRYDARAVATQRAVQTGALLLAGSATPRLESAVQMRTLRLASRVDGRPLPPVEILDMCGQRGGLHPVSAQALSDLRRDGGKAIVLLNRRGWSNFLSCRSCGQVWSCPNCDVALVMHRAQGTLACHHCDHRESIPAVCDKCGSSTLARHGTGTERLEHELTVTLGDGSFPIFRLDADTAGEDAAELLSRFERAGAGVLIGTQMVAKGHDFPDVRLGLVLDADSTLRFPDFRAEERTFALIAQLAGRVGRGEEGRVLVQSIDPQARSILHAAAHDSDGFLAGELERRRALGYPPFAHLTRIVCGASEARRARAAAEDLRAHMQAPLREAASLLGPASLFRLRGRERQALLVKARDHPAAVRAIGEAVSEVSADRRHAGVSFAVDVEPQ
ncbi:MAG TPA: primosomal protein N' [Solirubrobacteraceae bacterium]